MGFVFRPGGLLVLFLLSTLRIFEVQHELQLLLALDEASDGVGEDGMGQVGGVEVLVRDVIPLPVEDAEDREDGPAQVRGGLWQLVLEVVVDDVPDRGLLEPGHCDVARLLREPGRNVLGLGGLSLCDWH